MKKIIRSVVLCFALAFTTTAVAQNSDNCLIGRARGAAHNCLQGYYVTGFVDVIGVCAGWGEFKRVAFYTAPRNPNDWPLFFPRLVATVEFDCEGDVTVVCY